MYSGSNLGVTVHECSTEGMAIKVSLLCSGGYGGGGEGGPRYKAGLELQKAINDYECNLCK